jgi:hypothetical protein
MTHEMRQARIAHVRAHVESGKADIAILLANIARSFNVNNSLGLLSDFARANAMLVWYSCQDIRRARQWSAYAARMDFGTSQVQNGLRQPYAMFLALLWPLLANNKTLVEKYLELSRQRYSEKSMKDVRVDEYLLNQVTRAFAGDFELLNEGCAKWLAQPKLSKSQLFNEIDYHFLTALSVGDIDKMRYVLAGMVEPAEIKKHKNFENGYTLDLLSSKASIYAKLAWYHKFEINIVSDYIPVGLLSWDDTCEGSDVEISPDGVLLV